MAKPSTKKQGIYDLMDAVSGQPQGHTQESIKGDVCVSCGGSATEFKDAISVKEYRMSGLCQICQEEVFRQPVELDMQAIADAVKAQGFEAYVEQTGGGTATLYAGGPIDNDPEENWVVHAGPGWFEGPGYTLPKAEGGVYIGPGSSDEDFLVAETEEAAIEAILGYLRAKPVQETGKGW